MSLIKQEVNTEEDHEDEGNQAFLTIFLPMTYQVHIRPRLPPNLQHPAYLRFELPIMYHARMPEPASPGTPQRPLDRVNMRFKFFGPIVLNRDQQNVPGIIQPNNNENVYVGMEVDMRLNMMNPESLRFPGTEPMPPLSRFPVVPQSSEIQNPQMTMTPPNAQQPEPIPGCSSWSDEQLASSVTNVRELGGYAPHYAEEVEIDEGELGEYVPDYAEEVKMGGGAVGEHVLDNDEDIDINVEELEVSLHPEQDILMNDSPDEEPRGIERQCEHCLPVTCGAVIGMSCRYCGDVYVGCPHAGRHGCCPQNGLRYLCRCCRREFRTSVECTEHELVLTRAFGPGQFSTGQSTQLSFQPTNLFMIECNICHERIDSFPNLLSHIQTHL